MGRRTAPARTGRQHHGRGGRRRLFVLDRRQVHELARQAVLEAITPLRRVLLHRLALDALRSSPRENPNVSRLAHHAQGADDRQAILTYAPAAARQASAAGAHRTAAALFSRALSYAGTLPPADRAALVEAYAWECYLIADMPGAIASGRQAVELRREANDPSKQGEDLALLAIPPLRDFLGHQTGA